MTGAVSLQGTWGWLPLVTAAPSLPASRLPPELHGQGGFPTLLLCMKHSPGTCLTVLHSRIQHLLPNYYHQSLLSLFPPQLACQLHKGRCQAWAPTTEPGTLDVLSAMSVECLFNMSFSQVNWAESRADNREGHTADHRGTNRFRLHTIRTTQLNPFDSSPLQNPVLLRGLPLSLDVGHGQHSLMHLLSDIAGYPPSAKLEVTD